MASRKNLISAVVLTKNEEKNILECLKTLKWCDEIIVIDDYSEDGTLEKIFNFQFSIFNKIKIFKRHLDGDFAEQRNYGLKKAKGEWVLFVDADERTTEALASEIKNQISKIKKGGVIGFYLKRIDFMWGKRLRYGETGEIRLLRLAKKEAGKWARPVHEVWQINGQIGELTNPLLHYPHQTIREFLESINFYTTLNAKVFYEHGVKVSYWHIIVYPLAKFIKNYFLKLGFLDGMAGLLQATFMSFHSFLTRAKLWLLWQKF